MSNVKQFPTKKRLEMRNQVSHARVCADRAHEGEIVDIEEKINAAIQERLGKFVKEIQALKTKQKKLEDYQKAQRKISRPKQKSAKKAIKSASKKTKK